MIDLTKLKIGTKVWYKNRKVGESQSECEVVYIFKAYAIPSKRKIIKYYGEMVINPKFAFIFGPNKNDRIVLKRGKNDYIIIPLDTKVFRYCEIQIINN